MSVAINGLGRLGRAIFKILMANPELNVFAINDVTPPDNLPSTTGAGTATAHALPALRGRFQGTAVRVPVPISSLCDIVMLTERRTSAEEVNEIFLQEARGEPYAVVGVTEDPVVSSDIIQDARASVIDRDLTQVVDGDLVKVMSWYDNEWGLCESDGTAGRQHGAVRARRTGIACNLRSARSQVAPSHMRATVFMKECITLM